MAVHWIGIGGLFAELLEATRPLLGDARKHHDRAIKEAEGQVATAPKQAAPPLRVARALPLAGITELAAEPPLHWEGSGWRCVGATRIVIRSGDREPQTLELPDGTELPVRAGMLLLPPTSATAS